MVNTSETKKPAESMKISIMKRPSNDKLRENSSKESKTVPIKTLEQRQAEYNAARIRILGTAEPKEEDTTAEAGAVKDTSTEKKEEATEKVKKEKDPPKAKIKNKNKKQSSPPVVSPVSSSEDPSQKPSPVEQKSVKPKNSEDAYGPPQLTKQFQNIRFQGPHQKLWTPNQPLKAPRQPFRPNIPQQSHPIRPENSSFQPQNAFQNFTMQEFETIKQRFDERISHMTNSEQTSNRQQIQACKNPQTQSIPTAFSLRGHSTVNQHGPHPFAPNSHHVGNPSPQFVSNSHQAGNHIAPNPYATTNQQFGNPQLPYSANNHNQVTGSNNNPHAVAAYANLSVQMMPQNAPQNPSLPMPLAYYQSTPPPPVKQMTEPRMNSMYRFNSPSLPYCNPEKREFAENYNNGLREEDGRDYGPQTYLSNWSQSYS